MKFAIISDTHDNFKNFEKMINWCNAQKITLILHCGDIAKEETIKASEKLFNGNIQFVRGNADYTVKDLPDVLDLDIGGKKVAFVHFPEPARKMAQSGKYDIVFYGHTHKPWEEKINNCRLVNPGEGAGQMYKPTFAVYNTETDLLELKILERLD